MTTETAESTQIDAETARLAESEAENARAFDLAKAIADQHQQLTDPVGFAKRQFNETTETERAALVLHIEAGRIHPAALVQFDEVRGLMYARQFPDPEPPPAKPAVRTFDGLGLILIGGDSALPPAIREYAQMVQPDRGCSAADAEHFLAKAAYRDIRGGLYTDGQNPQPIVVNRYSVDREADKITLRLHA